MGQALWVVSSLTGSPRLSLQIQIVKRLFFQRAVLGRDAVVIIPEKGQMAGNLPLPGQAARTLHPHWQTLQRAAVQERVQGLMDALLCGCTRRALPGPKGNGDARFQQFGQGRAAVRSGWAVCRSGPGSGPLTDGSGCRCCPAGIRGRGR